MAVAESCRLAGALREEGVPLHTIVINQVGRHFHSVSCVNPLVLTYSVAWPAMKDLLRAILPAFRLGAMHRSLHCCWSLR